MTLANIVGHAEHAAHVATANWGTVVLFSASLMLLSRVFRPRSAADVAASLRDSITGSRPPVAIVGNSPSIEYLCKVAQTLYTTTSTPVLVIG
jgi:hypothetical protein